MCKNYNVYYYCPCVDDIFGGAKQIYRHVQILREYGISAYVFGELGKILSSKD